MAQWAGTAQSKWAIIANSDILVTATQQISVEPAQPIELSCVDIFVTQYFFVLNGLKWLCFSAVLF